MRSLDGKLKHQIDRLLKLSKLDPDEARTAVLRPNPNALLDDDDEDEDEDNENDSEDNLDDDDNDDNEFNSDIDDEDESDEDDDDRHAKRKQGSKQKSSADQKNINKKGDSVGVYKAPRLSAVPYNENQTEEDKAQKKLDIKRKKLKNSEILDSLREEFGDAPEVTLLYNDKVTLLNSNINNMLYHRL